MSKQGPVIFDDDVEPTIDVDSAPHIDVEHTAMAIVTKGSARRTGWLGRILIFSIGSLLSLAVGMSFWNFITNLLTTNVIMGRIALGLFVVIGAISVLYIIREFISIWKLGRVDALRQEVRDAWNSGSINAAQKASKGVSRLIKTKTKADWENAHKDILDAKELIEFTERKLLASLDELAQDEIKMRARRVAVVTAFVPLALVDLITVLTSNIGMIRRIAEIYGGRPGVIGGWRLFQKVATHLVATGAVAVGDDMIGSLLGGGVLSKVSRRFGEGVVNAALTTRVGIATIEVCRPMDFHALKEPSTSTLVSKALAGFSSSQKNGS